MEEHDDEMPMIQDHSCLENGSSEDGLCWYGFEYSDTFVPKNIDAENF